MDTTQGSIDRWPDEQNVVYTYNGRLSSLKKGNSAINNNINKSCECYAKGISQHKKTNALWFHLFEVVRVVKQNHKNGKYNGGRQRLGGGENVELLFNGYRVLVLQDEKLWGWMAVMVA